MSPSPRSSGWWIRRIVPDEQELIAFTAARLASYKKPREIVFVAELPRGASGKILKRTLRDTLRDAEVPS